MKVTFELKDMDLAQANAYFAAISSSDETPIVDLATGTIQMIKTVAATYPRKSPDSGFDYLVLHKIDLAKAQRWWNSLRRVDSGDSTYTLLNGKESMLNNTYSGLGLNSANHKIYNLKWDQSSDVVVPDMSPEHTNLELDLFPEFDWNSPMGTEPTA